MLLEELRPELDPHAALAEAQEIAREAAALIEIGATPNFVDVDRLCELVLDFVTVTTKKRS